MLVFVDESGDPGLKIGRGSSPYFIVATVVFPTKQVTQECQQQIQAFRVQQGLRHYKEFHFSKDNLAIKRGFLEAVAEVPFWFGAAVVDKQRLHSHGLEDHKNLYHYTVNLAFKHILDELKDATVVFDSCGGREFSQQLRRYVQKKAKEHTPDGSRLKKVKSNKSHADDLLQLADMVCGAIARSYTTGKHDSRLYRNILRDREKLVRVWPELTPRA